MNITMKNMNRPLGNYFYLKVLEQSIGQLVHEKFDREILTQEV